MKIIFLSLIFIAGKCFGSNQNIDQIQYYNELKNTRPELVKTNCKPNLILKPEYRASVIKQGESFDSIKEKHYSKLLQKQDIEWGNKFRDFFKNADFSKHPDLVRADYDENYQIGIEVVGSEFKFDKSGYMYKTYLTLKNDNGSLDPETYLNFSSFLSKGGFKGDSKVQVFPGTYRFQFNNIVIHAQNMEMAKKSEVLSREFFKNDLVFSGRGIDVKNLKTNEVLDWNNYLCTYGDEAVKGEALRFVKYQD